MSSSLDKIVKVDVVESILYNDGLCIGRGWEAGSVHVGTVCSLTIRTRWKLYAVALNDLFNQKWITV